MKQLLHPKQTKSFALAAACLLVGCAAPLCTAGSDSSERGYALPLADPDVFSGDPFFQCPPEANLDGAEVRLATAGWVIGRRTSTYLQTAPRLLTGLTMQVQQLRESNSVEQEYLQLFVGRTDPLGDLRYSLIIWSEIQTRQRVVIRYPTSVPALNDELSDGARRNYNSIRWSVCGDMGYLKAKTSTSTDTPPIPPREDIEGPSFHPKPNDKSMTDNGTPFAW